MGGIYKIENLVNGKTYVGSTRNKIAYRWYCHKKTLRKNIHKNIRLQRAWNKYGDANFKFEVLEELIDSDRNILCQREHYFRTLLGSEYNISPTDIPGTLTDEQRKKLSNSLKLRYKNGFSDEHKKRISQSKKGKKFGPMSLQHKLKISNSRKGKCIGKSHTVYKGKFVFVHPIFGKEIIHQWGMVQKYGLDVSKISSICSGKRHSHKQWVCEGKVE